MPESHAPFARRFVFAACASDPRSPLSRTQRVAILTSVADPAWDPVPEALPQTWEQVMQWYAGLSQRAVSALMARFREPQPTPEDA